MCGGGESEAGKEDCVSCCRWQGGSVLCFTPGAYRMPCANIHPTEGGLSSYSHVSIG